jgi:predicted metalloprotease
VKFVSFVVEDVQRTWEKEFPKLGGTYQRAKLVLFRDETRSGCGFAEATMGPFYCPADQRVYLDLGFFDELRSRFGAPGEFAEAYVIAHEFGHHVQRLLGIEEKVRRTQEERPSMRNELSVRTELQADCLAGVWGHSTGDRNILEKGDVESGLAAAAAVGDDRLQKAATGRVSPESWTHGSSKERTEWFTRGLQTGQVGACDTFARAAR